MNIALGTAGRFNRHARLITALVAGTFFMETLDATVIATALPKIGQEFGVSAVSLNIGMTAYLLALAVFIPISGWLAGRTGARNLFTAAILLFTFASLLCGLSRSLWTFTAARALQGAGGAAMVPVGRLIVLGMTEKKDLAQAMARIVWPGLIAPVLGPPLGGFIVVHLSWSWIFYLNIPLGLIAAASAATLVPGGRGSLTPRPLDLPGFILSSIALLLIVYGLDAIGNGQQRATVAAGIIAIGGVIGCGSVVHLRRHPAPLLDLRVFAAPSFAFVARAGSLQRIAISTVPFLLPLLFQLGFGMNALRSGEMLLFVFAGNLAMKMVTIPLLRRFGYRDLLLVNGVLSGVAIGACALLAPSTPYWLTAALLFAGGAFRSMQFAGLSGIQFIDVPADRLTHANTLSTMLTQLAMGLAVVAAAGLLNLSALLAGRAPGAPILTDFRFAFVGVMIIALLGLVEVLRLDPDMGRSDRS